MEIFHCLKPIKPSFGATRKYFREFRWMKSKILLLQRAARQINANSWCDLFSSTILRLKGKGGKTAWGIVCKFCYEIFKIKKKMNEIWAWIFSRQKSKNENRFSSHITISEKSANNEYHFFQRVKKLENWKDLFYFIKYQKKTVK